jgi:hypothetical protein
MAPKAVLVMNFRKDTNSARSRKMMISYASAPFFYTELERKSRQFLIQNIKANCLTYFLFLFSWMLAPTFYTKLLRRIAHGTFRIYGCTIRRYYS